MGKGVWSGIHRFVAETLDLIDDTIIWVFPKIGAPKTPKKMIMFSRKTHGCWVPPFLETSISTRSPEGLQMLLSFTGNQGGLINTEDTPPKTNMEPENHPFRKEKHLPNLHFWVPC